MTDAQQLARTIVDRGWFKKGDFTLSSGVKSNYYIDLRPCMLSVGHIHSLTVCLTQLLCRDRGYGHLDRISGVELGGVPTPSILAAGDLLCGVITSGLFLTGALLQRMSTTAFSLGAVYVRTEHRNHGSRKDIEGVFHPGQNVVLIDDVATSGRSLHKVARILTEAGLKVKAAAVVVDREEGAAELLGSLNVLLCSVLKMSDLEMYQNDETNRRPQA